MRVHFGEDVDNDYETYNEALGSYICLCCTVLTTGSTLIFALYHVYVTKNINGKLKVYTYTLISSLSLNFLYCLRIYIAEHVNIMTSHLIGCGEIPYVLLPGSVFLGLARLSLYFFYLSRFHNIFDNTNFDFTTKTYKILITSMCTLLLISMTNYESVVLITKCNPNYYLFAGGFAVLQDAFWSIFMCICFIQRLKAVIASLYGFDDQNHIDKNSKNSKNSKISKNDTNDPMHYNTTLTDKVSPSQGRVASRSPSVTSKFDSTCTNSKSIATYATPPPGSPIDEIQVIGDIDCIDVNSDDDDVKENNIDINRARIASVTNYNDKSDKTTGIIRIHKSEGRDIQGPLTQQMRQMKQMTQNKDRQLTEIQMSKSKAESPQRAVTPTISYQRQCYYKDVETARNEQRQRRLMLIEVCKKMTVITSTTCISTIVAIGLTGSLFNVAVTTTIDVSINGMSILLVFAFMERWYNIIFCCFGKACKNN